MFIVEFEISVNLVEFDSLQFTECWENNVWISVFFNLLIFIHTKQIKGPFTPVDCFNLCINICLVFYSYIRFLFFYF